MALSRVLEPEVMDSLEEADQYDAMDHADVNRVFVDDLLAIESEPGDVLDLGAIADNPDSVDAALRAAADQGADGIITSGGVSRQLGLPCEPGTRMSQQRTLISGTDLAPRLPNLAVFLRHALGR